MTLNILVAPTEEDAKDWDQATQVQECIPLLQAGRMCPRQHRDSARDAEVKSRCPGTRISLPSLPGPSAPSLGWGPFTPSCLSFPPAHSDCSNTSPASGSPWPHAGGAAHCPLWLLGSVPSRTQVALVCSLASVPALPSPPSGLGQEVSPPRLTNWLERLPVPQRDRRGQQGARPQTQLTCAPVPSQDSHSHPQPQLCLCPPVCMVGLAGLGL